MTEKPNDWTPEEWTKALDQIANEAGADLVEWQDFADIIQAELRSRFTAEDARIIKNAIIQFSITGVTRFDPFICGFFLDHNLLMDRNAAKVAALAVQEKPITYEVIFNLYKQEAVNDKDKPNQ